VNNLLALAIAPGLAICLFIFHRDAYNREPKRNLILSFFLGACSIITAIFVEGLLKDIPSKTISGTAVSAFLVVALTEELGKFLVLRYYAYRRKSFDEPLDGIVYGVMISMGFATLENVLYVAKYAELGQGYQIAFLRMFTAVPAHATFGVLMGYHVGKAKFDSVNETRLLLTGLFWAVLFHGAYDYCLFLQGLPAIKDIISDGFLFLGAIISFIIAIRLSFKHIKTHRRLSQQTYRPEETMSLRKGYPHDIPLIRDMAYKIWPVTYGNILSKDQLDYMLNLIYSEQALNDQMKSDHEFFMLYDGVQPIGFASYGLVEPNKFKLHKIYVLPSYQGKGAGRFVIGELINAIKRKGGTSLLLNVNRNNPAKSFYEKSGFVVIKEEDIDIGSGYFMNDYVMEKSLV
jgi:RsiW-degrading membrane proteinase PrsW (M82 family)/ribosomal protein S18 acetylase RimI-like enzyme